MWGIIVAGGIFLWMIIPESRLFHSGMWGVVVLVLGLINWFYVSFSVLRVHRRFFRSVNGIDSLITEGVYSVVRHPLYIADVILAWSVFFFLPFSRVLTEAIWMTFVLWFWAGLEERALEDRFLEDYREYKKKVPKFLPQWRKRDS